MTLQSRQGHNGKQETRAEPKALVGTCLDIRGREGMNEHPRRSSAHWKPEEPKMPLTPDQASRYPLNFKNPQTEASMKTKKKDFPPHEFSSRELVRPPKSEFSLFWTVIGLMLVGWLFSSL